MLKNYFTISVRNIRKRKFFAAINILGLTAGICACLLIALYILDEFSYDRFHVNADRIYQMGGHSKYGDVDHHSASTCPPLADAMIAEIPEVESTLRMTSGGTPVLRYGDKAFKETKVLTTERNFFEFFSFKLIAGDVKTVLKEPNTVVLTERTARKLFGDEDPLEKLIAVEQGHDSITYKVTGVAADCPGNSHVKFDVLLSPRGDDNYFEYDAWLNSGVYTYFLLRENTSVSDVEKKLENLVAKYVAPQLKNFLGNSLDQTQNTGGAYRYYTTKVTDIHLKSTSMDQRESGGSMMYMLVFGGIGIFILAIACINFMNLSTAQSVGRAKEVGLRKTLGSLRGQMIVQFLAESMLYSFAAVVLAVVLCFVLLPAFNSLSGKELSLINLLDLKFMLGVALLLLIVGLLAGSYPAFYLTSFKPVEVLKGKVHSGVKSKGIRSSLVVLQFAISIFLIIFTSVVYNQVSFMQQQQMGMDKKNVLVIENMSRVGDNNGEAFREALLQQSGVSKVSFSDKLPMRFYNSFPMRSGGSTEEHSVAAHWADDDFQDVLKFEMKEGRYFSKDILSDSNAVVVNEAAAREFGFDKSEGHEILFSPNAFVFKPYRVVGIVKDFNFESYRDNVRPLVIFLSRSAAGDFEVRYEGNAKNLIDNVTKVWKRFAGSEPIDYTFMDEDFDNLYQSEVRIGKILTVFSGLAIFIACLGLFALAAFTAEQRTKEIGIRKVLGASVASVSLTLTKEFIVLVLIAFVPAAAIGWWASYQWLNGFAFRVDISLPIFVVAGVSAIAIAWLTVGYQSAKAARANPVDSLRHE